MGSVAVELPDYTANPDAAPVMVVSATSSEPAVSLRVVRIIDGVESMVRTPGEAFAGVLSIVEDHEAPTGVPVAYRVEWLDGAGDVVDQAQVSAPGVLRDAPESYAWLSDPLQQDARMVMMSSETDLERPFETPVDDVHGFGSALAHTAHGTRQHGLRQFEVLCFSPEEHVWVGQVLAGPVLLRVPSWRLMLPMLQGVPREVVERAPRRQGDPWLSYWMFQILPSRGPGASVLLPRRTWRDVLNEADSWDDLAEQYDDWAGVLRGQF